MKKKYLILPLLLLVVLLSACTEKEPQKNLADEYTSLTKDNIYVYKTSEEIIKILEHGTGIVFLGFPECKWCQAYAPMLNDIADTEGLEKISYYNIRQDREENNATYQKMVEILSDYLEHHDDDGNKRIYVPAVVAVSEGEIVGYDDETSYDTKGFDNPEDYWTDDEKQDLTTKLTDIVNSVLNNKCTACNK